MNPIWLDIGPVSQVETGMARTLPVAGGEEIAIFRTLAGDVYALINKCPHRQGPLSQGIIHGDCVTCPLHNYRISLKTGEALGEDSGRTPVVPVRIRDGRIYIDRAATLASARQAA